MLGAVVKKWNAAIVKYMFFFLSDLQKHIVKSTFYSTAALYDKGGKTLFSRLTFSSPLGPRTEI